MRTDQRSLTVALAVLIRLADGLEVGSPERRAIADATGPLSDALRESAHTEKRAHLRLVHSR
jgi:hypothetical protein